jgi:gluconokinase
VLEYRVSNRPGHFMPASLLDSQLATLEKPGLDENVITVNFALSVEQIVARGVAFLAGAEQRTTQ